MNIAAKRRESMRKHYIALGHKDADSDYGSRSRISPAVTTADSLDEAVERAGDALALHVEAWPKARAHPTAFRLRRSHQG
jgi:predicted RNase H-like HicB family nuclease